MENQTPQTLRVVEHQSLPTETLPTSVDCGTVGIVDCGKLDFTDRNATYIGGRET